MILYFGGRIAIKNLENMELKKYGSHKDCIFSA